MPTVKLTSDELSLVLAALDQLPEFSDQQLCDNLERKLYEAKKTVVARPSGGIWAPRICYRDTGHRKTKLAR